MGMGASSSGTMISGGGGKGLLRSVGVRGEVGDGFMLGLAGLNAKPLSYNLGFLSDATGGMLSTASFPW